MTSEQKLQYKGNDMYYNKQIWGFFVLIKMNKLNLNKDKNGTI